MENTPGQLKELFIYLFALIRNPVEQIKKLPHINWKTLILFQFCLSSLSVIVANSLAPFAISLPHVLISLIVAVVATGLVSLFFYYFFLFIYNQKLSFIKLFTLVLFAHIPFALFHLGAYFFPPSDLIGLAISAILMVVGLVENFSVPRKLAMQLMVACYIVFVMYWITHLITLREHSKMSIPQSLDSMEREIKKSF